MSKNESLALIAKVNDDYLLDGYSIIKLNTIRKVFSIENDTRIVTARTFFGLVYPQAPQITLTSLTDFFRNWTEIAPIVIHIEKADPEICYIGMLTKIKARSFLIKTIDVNSKFENEMEFPYADVTRVDFLGRYESILFLGTLINENVISVDPCLTR